MSAKVASFLMLLGVCALALGQAPAQPVDPAARIEQWIDQLGDEQYAVREAATKGLAELGGRARPAVERAAQSADLEVAFRAKSILENLPKLTHTVVDALGGPVPGAALTLKITPGPATGGDVRPNDGQPEIKAAISEDDGRVAIPPLEASGRITAIVQHPEYGTAQCDVDVTGNNAILRLPLVRQGSEAFKRAITGRLVSSDGKPVAGAVVSCNEVRTPGEGLIDGGSGRYGEALTGDDGQFAYYLPNENRRGERGDLIPANSRYLLRIEAPGDDSLFPVAGGYVNLAPVKIEMQRATRFHRFRFEAIGGGWIENAEQLKQVRVQYEGHSAGNRVLVPLDEASVASGRKLVPGKYLAETFVDGKMVQFVPLVVAANSPEELSFELPHAETFRGRVVDGITGQPAANTLVMGWNSTSHNNLAQLTADDWKLLAEVPSNPPLDHPAVVRLRELYGVQALVRTDSQGRFEIVRQSDQDFYGFIAFAPDVIPFKVRVGSLPAPQNHRVDVGDFPLFPAARLVVRPVFGEDHPAVAPKWLPAETGQPEWFARFQAAQKSSDREFEYIHWLTLNEPQPIFVPAGIRMQVRFETPYHDQWSPALVNDVQLEPRAVKEVGDLHFAASLPIVVRVSDKNGKPVEGAPVRRMYQGENAWCVAHNTDGQGLARFFVHPNSQGQFRVTDLPGPREEQPAENLLAGFKVGGEAPKDPLAISLTDAQLELLRGGAKGRPN